MEESNYEIENNILYIKSDPKEQIELFDTKITKIYISEGVTSLNKFSIYAPSVTEVYVPNTICKLFSRFSLLQNASYIFEDIKIPKEIIEKEEYDFNHIFKIYQLSQIENFNIVLKIPKEVLEIIPIDSEIVKSFTRNKKRFDKVLEKNTFNLSVKELYIISNVLGLFNENNDDIVDVVIDFCNKNNDYIRNKLSNISAHKYNSIQSRLILKLADENSLRVDGYNVFYKVITEFTRIKKYTEKLRKEENYRYKSNLNTHDISIKDVLEYIRNHIYNLPDEYSELEEALNIVADYPHITYSLQDIIDKIIRLYDKAKQYKKDIPILIEKNSSISYEWLESTDSRNIILPYITKSCAKLYSKGEGNFKEVMTNPNVVNLIIKDPQGKIIGKTTAYFNFDEGYILFNNFECVFSDFFYDSRKEVLFAIIRAINDMIRALQYRGIIINGVRMGVGNNKLEELLGFFPVETTSLLKNCPKFTADETYNQYVLSNGELIDIDTDFAVTKKH